MEDFTQKLTPWIVSKYVLPMCCSCNGAFFARGTRRVLTFVVGLSIYSFSFGITGKAHSGCVGLVKERGGLWWRRCFGILLLRGWAMCYGKRVSLHFCGVFRLRDRIFVEVKWSCEKVCEMARIRASLKALVSGLFCNYDLGIVFWTQVHFL